MLTPPKTEEIEEELVVMIGGPLDCPWRFARGVDYGPVGCPEGDVFPSPCPVRNAFTVTVKMKE